MGYRSDVRISTNKADYQKFVEYVGNIKGLISDNGPEFYDEDEDSVIFGWDQVKWYEEYDDVSTVMNALDELSGECCFEYIRVGDDDDDIEHRVYGNWWNLERHLGTETRIVWW